ncbi:hypothetical protein IHQ71_05400 [Rhizobium sp. TH2]|uniref:hypothetical protein n=1 Tax=Rhizobium sp. TH2 TaxID=2775403 RepID=UPI00215770EE|nr:hypothetical protein [Rhizobium sp. TH2]UVC10042.1 hypothetical protein IHQ71_05400 [Rhizobium sp. TH2]
MQMLERRAVLEILRISGPSALILQQVDDHALLPREQPMVREAHIIGTTIPADGAKKPQAEESPAEFVPQPGFSIFRQKVLPTTAQGTALRRR